MHIRMKMYIYQYILKSSCPFLMRDQVANVQQRLVAQQVAVGLATHVPEPSKTLTTQWLPRPMVL